MQTYTEATFMEHMRVYNAVENSPLGHLLQEGNKYIILSTDEDFVTFSKEADARTLSDKSLSSYGYAEDIINKILELSKIQVHVNKYGSEVKSISLKYSYLIYTERRDGVKTLVFKTDYSYEDIIALRVSKQELHK